MLTRLLDTLLPAIVLGAMVIAMSLSFGGLGRGADTPTTVTLQRVVIDAQREMPPTEVVAAEPTSTAPTVR